MAKEKEVKILEINPSIVIPQLISLGAQKIFDDELYTEFFDYDDKSIKDSDCLLRLRDEGKEVVLTLKEPSKEGGEKGVKSLEETEVVVSSFKNMKRILEFLGLGIYRKMNKKRTTYQLNHVKYELDKYLGEFNFIPYFLEIEGPDKNTIVAYAQKIGFSEKDCKDWNLSKLINHYNKK